MHALIVLLLRICLKIVHLPFTDACLFQWPIRCLCKFCKCYSFFYSISKYISSVSYQRWFLDILEKFQTVRVLLSSGSQANFISQTCLKRLGIHRQQSSIPITGISKSPSITKGVTNYTIKPSDLDYLMFSFDALVLPKLCEDITSVRIDPRISKHIS